MLGLFLHFLDFIRSVVTLSLLSSIFDIISQFDYIGWLVKPNTPWLAKGPYVLKIKILYMSGLCLNNGSRWKEVKEYCWFEKERSLSNVFENEDDSCNLDGEILWVNVDRSKSIKVSFTRIL